MQFKLSKLSTAPKNQFRPQESAIEYIRCRNCPTREEARISVSLTARGLQIWCDNCDWNVLHIELKGDVMADPHKHGKFNERNKKSPMAETMNDYCLDLNGLGCITSSDLRQKKIEEMTDSGIVNNLRHNHAS